MSSKNLKKTKKDKPGFSIIKLIGGFLIIVALFIPIKTYLPVFKAEVNYQLNKKVTQPKEFSPVDPAFSIIIPKINANAKVIRNVNPYNATEYQRALTKGVAHASGSANPGEPGNVFIFAHSATNWYQANQYNAVFYLLNKLEKGDSIIVYFNNIPYNYSVDEIKFVRPDEINYLSTNLLSNKLTLMTCWPPGTTLKRLIVIATKNK
jgi:LPXTG-site transpeptidase (sortase) family protein